VIGLFQLGRERPTYIALRVAPDKLKRTRVETYWLPVMKTVVRQSSRLMGAVGGVNVLLQGLSRALAEPHKWLELHTCML
jgi:hypothetical protein